MTLVPDPLVLDSYALLALLQDEPGAEQVARLIRDAQEGRARLYMSVVNLGEVVYRTIRAFGLERALAVLARLEELPIEAVDVDRDLALEAARLKGRHAVAYADCLAAALAMKLGATVVTGNPEFRRLEGVITVGWLGAG